VSLDNLQFERLILTPSYECLNSIKMVSRHNPSIFRLPTSWRAACASLFLSFCAGLHAQVDQGAITGVVQDSSGAAIPNAHVTLTNTYTGLILRRDANASGVYVFSPVKIGNHEVSASAPGFQTTLQQNVHVDIQQRLNINIQLQ